MITDGIIIESSSIVTCHFSGMSAPITEPPPPPLPLPPIYPSIHPPADTSDYDLAEK